MATQRPSEVALYRRNARHLTPRRVLHEVEKQEAVASLPFLRRRRARAELTLEWDEAERLAAADGAEVIGHLSRSAAAFAAALAKLAAVDAVDLRGKVEPEIERVDSVKAVLEEARLALGRRDFGAAGERADHAARELWLVGGPLVVTLNEALARAASGRTQRNALVANMEARSKAKGALEQARLAGPAAGAKAAATVHALEAAGLELAAAVLEAQRRAPRRDRGRTDPLRPVSPADLETFDDVAGLSEVKDQLRATVDTILEDPAEAAHYDLVHNGILFYGPPGTGKTLLSRALAGEYGLRYLRVSPADVGSGVAHETAVDIRRLFQIAADATPCLLFLDEIDSLAPARDDAPGSEHREVVTQLMTSLEEYRSVEGLVVCAATNDIDSLDAGLREGRFDARILVPLPDRGARREILGLHLERRAESVRWEDVDLGAIVEMTGGRNAAALAQTVTLAAQAAHDERRSVGQQDLVGAVRQGEARDRVTLDDGVSWSDVVLPDAAREQLMDLVKVFSQPAVARSLGIHAPPGILLHGPPGTGKTMIARAMATEAEASFYEHSAADLLSKWAGESEVRVAKIFARARANRPSIIFIDEIDSLLRTRGGDSANQWEGRVVSEFLRELDGLTSATGVLLVGATNRPDVIDPALRSRRLIPVEVPLPDGPGRLQLLRKLLAPTAVAPDVDLRRLAASTEGLSGADLKRLRDLAGMRTLGRASRSAPGGQTRITWDDLETALGSTRSRATISVV